MAEGDVLKIVSGHQAFAAGGGGGGGVTAAGVVSGSVANVTEIRLAGSVSEVSPGIAEQALVVQLFVAELAFDTPSLSVEATNPGLLTFPGITLATLPAGAILRDFYIDWQDPWDAGPGHAIDLDIGPSSGPVAAGLAAAQISNSGLGPVGSVARYLKDMLDGTTTRYLWSGGAVNIVVAYDTGPLVSGTANVYLIAAVPAS